MIVSDEAKAEMTIIRPLCVIAMVFLIAITFNPELDSSLKEFSEESQGRLSSDYKYIALKLWSENKIRLDDNYKKYEVYENSPHVALEEAKEIIDQLLKQRESGEESRDSESFFLLNRSIPAYVCCTLIKYHESDLEKQDVEFCKDFVLDSLQMICTSSYSYQVGDGIDACVYVLPDLLEMFPDDSEDIKLFLLISLFKEYPIDMWGGSRFYDLAINAIHSLWDTKPDDAESLMLGCLSLRYKYFELMYFSYKSIAFSYSFFAYINNTGLLLGSFISINLINFSNLLSSNLLLKC